MATAPVACFCPDQQKVNWCTPDGYRTHCSASDVRQPPISTADLDAYTSRAGTNASSICYVKNALLAGRLLYCKDGWKDGKDACGKQTSINLGASAVVGKAVGLAAAGTGAAAGIGALSGAEAGTAFGAGGIVAESASIIGLAALPFTVWGIFSAHHAQAVATEQETLCAVSVAYNQFSDALEKNLATGKVDLATGVAASDDAIKQLVEAMQPIYKTCNAACGLTYGLKALGLYNKEVFYPRLVPSASNIAADLASGNVGTLLSELAVWAKSHPLIAGLVAVGIVLALRRR